MKLRIDDQFLVEVAEGTNRRLPFPVEVASGFRKRLIQIKESKDIQDLRNIKSLHFEKLKEKRYKDKYSIRINKQYRIIFRIDKDGQVDVIAIEEVTKHYET